MTININNRSEQETEIGGWMRRRRRKVKITKITKGVSCAVFSAVQRCTNIRRCASLPASASFHQTIFEIVALPLQIPRCVLSNFYFFQPHIKTHIYYD